jgi:hypothetical protein
MKRPLHVSCMENFDFYSNYHLFIFPMKTKGCKFGFYLRRIQGFFERLPK